jgi:O-antigen/teichoic acid export membrane protein
MGIVFRRRRVTDGVVILRIILLKAKSLSKNFLPFSSVKFQVIKNTVYIFAGRASNAVFLFLLTLTVSRYLGPALFGVYSLLTTVVITANCFSNFGFDVWMVREVTKNPSQAKKYLSNILGFKIVTSLVTIFLVYLIFQATNLPPTTLHLLLILSASLLFNTLSQSLWHYGDCFKRFVYHSVLWASSNAIKSALGISLVLFYGELEPLIWGIVIAEAITLILSFCVIRYQFGTFIPEFRLSIWKDYLARSAPIALGMIFSVLYFRLDIVMLQLMTDEKVVGYYSAAYKLFEMSIVFPTSIMLVLFPTLVAEYHSDYPQFKKSSKKALGLFFLFGGGIALILWGFPREIITIIFGDEFSPSIAVLKILSGAIFLFFLNYLLANILISSGREKINTWNLLGATVINIMLNMALIPQYGASGAAWSTLFCEAVLVIALGIEVRKCVNSNS